MDALRSLLMIWGIAVHASTLSISPFLQEVARVSGYVRMEGFMTISGLLVGLLIERYGHSATIRRRLISLGVPLLTTLVLLNPVTNYLAYCFHNEPIPFSSYVLGEGLPLAEGPMVWHLHLWFLFALLAYGLLTPWLSRAVDLLLNRGGPLLARLTPDLRFLAICVALPVACLLSRLVFEFLLEPYLARTWVFVTRSTLYYLPFYALGLTLYRCAPLLESFTRIRFGHLLLAPLLVAAITLNFRDLPKLAAETARLLAESYLSVVLAAALFALARRYFSQERRWATFLADAAYSIYLLHFLVIYVLAMALRPLLGDTGLLVVLVIAGTFAVTAALHAFVIRRVPLLRFLLNGRSARPAAAAPVPAPPSEADPAFQISRS